MKTTQTGHFPIGFRRGWSDWQKDLARLIGWAQQNGFGVLDLGTDALKTAPQVIGAGLRIGSVDLLDWQGLISPDASKRHDAVQKNEQLVAELGPLGPLNYFAVMLPEKPELSRRENFGWMVESFTALAPTLEKHAARVVVEGYPGAGALCCTPEGYRAFFSHCPSRAMAVNYDPSHLIRMGIDPVRFLREFVDRVGHVHGKDTAVLTEEMYEFGREQPATFATQVAFGGFSWRYTIPGEGQMAWSEAFQILHEAGYKGSVCVELEDADYNGSEEGEKQGLLRSRQYLESC